MALLCPPPSHLKSQIRIDTDASTNDVCRGRVVCECENDEMEVYYFGKIFKRFFKTPVIKPLRDEFDNSNLIGFLLKCKKCGREILAYDSNVHSYSKNKDKRKIKTELYKPFRCDKCDNKYFLVDIELQHLSISFEDLNDSGVNGKNDNFDWIIIDLKCQSCLKEFMSFINHETIE